MLKTDPLIKECGINVREPENISRFLGNFSFKTTQMLRDINFKTFKKLLKKKKLREIVIDIDSRVVNVEDHQEGATKGYNHGNLDNNCYNALVAFCDELKAYVTGFIHSSNAYTSNGAAEIIKEIVANLKDEVDNIIFRMDSGYFSEEIVEVIENAEYQYVIKAKHYPNMVDNAYKRPVKIWEAYGDEKQAMFCCMKPEDKRKQHSLFESDDYDHDFYVTNITWGTTEIVRFYEKHGNCEKYIKETKYDMNISFLKMKPFSRL